MIKIILVFWNLFFEKLFFKFFYVYLLLEKLINRKHFSVKGKFRLVSEKCFPEKFGRKTLSGSCEKFRNVILFADYIKFDPQTFDYNIYILFWIFIFQFYLLKFNFYINFGLYFYNCYLLFPYHFLLKFFMYQIWSSFFWLLLILLEIIYEMLIIIILISSSFNFFIF